MGSYSSFNGGIKYLLCVIDIFTKDAWVKLLKNKTAKTVLQGFVEILNEPNRNSKKLWIDQGRQFYNSFIQIWLDDNVILMYRVDTEGKSVVVERFIKTLRCKIYKKFTANESKSYLAYLNKLVDQYNNTHPFSIG